MMNILRLMLPRLPLFILSVFIEYRFSVRLLQRRFSKITTFMVLFCGEFLAGYFNYYFLIAGTTETNTLYNGFVFFVLCCLLFRGDIAKRFFVSAFVICGINTLYYITLPFSNYFFAGNAHVLIFSANVIKYFNSLLCILWMDYIGKKLQNLHYDPPQNYTVYLSVIMLFVYVAVYSLYGRIIEGHINSQPSFLNVLISSSFATLGMLIVWYAVFELDKQVSNSLLEQMRNMQMESLHNRETQWKMLSGFRHDINNHMICLTHLLTSKKYEEAVEYVDNLADTVKQLSSPVQTGNEYADALLGVKYSEAKKYDIDISIDMTVPQDGFMEPVDICCILSNALDNAIAACNRMEAKNRWIKVRSFIAQNQFVLEVLNSKPVDVKVVGDSVYPAAVSIGHGLGLQNVKSVVKKYGGILDLSADDAFSFSVMIPISRL